MYKKNNIKCKTFFKWTFLPIKSLYIYDSECYLEKVMVNFSLKTQSMCNGDGNWDRLP